MHKNYGLNVGEAILAGIVISAITLAVPVGILVASNISLENKTEKEFRKINIDIDDIKNFDIIVAEQDYRAVFECTNKDLKEPIIVEYKIPNAEYVAMQQPASSEWDYVLTYIIPNNTPSFVGTEKEYEQYLKNPKTQSKTEKIEEKQMQ